MNDLRSALRQLLKNRGLTTVAVLTLALGIGANTAMFSFARRRDVLGLVIGQGMRLAFAGVTLGMLGAFGLTRVLQRLLYEIKPTDSLTFATVAATLVFITFLACWLPARRAAKVDPMEAAETRMIQNHERPQICLPPVA